MPLTSLRSVLAMLAMSLCLSLNSFSQTEPTDAKAQYDLGLAYHEGTVVPKDDVEAVKWFRKAANQGDAVAQCELGCAYHAGEGVPKDDVQAVKWFRKAADQGHVSAQRTLALAYHEGSGVSKDYTESLKWFSKAGADNGIGLAYFNRGLEGYAPKNYEESKKWDAKEFVKSFSKELNRGVVGYTPKRGSAERQAVADGMREYYMQWAITPIPKNKKLVTRFDYLKMNEKYAVAETVPLFEDGSWADDYIADEGYTVVLHKTGATWVAIASDVRGDVPSQYDVMCFLKDLPSDFPPSLLPDFMKDALLGTHTNM